MEDDFVNSQDIKTLTLLLQIKQNNNGADLNDIIMGEHNEKNSRIPQRI